MLDSWQLVRGAEILAELRFTHADQPWLFCTFHPRPVFSSVASFFARDVALLESNDQAAKDAAANAIDNLGLTLVNVSSGETISEFWLHVQGQQAWFRC